MREWLSGGAPPCQGGGRGFDPRLALFYLQRKCFSLRHFRYFYAFEKVGTFEDVLGTVSFLLWNASRETTLSAIFAVAAAPPPDSFGSVVTVFFRDNASVSIL